MFGIGNLVLGAYSLEPFSSQFIQKIYGKKENLAVLHLAKLLIGDLEFGAWDLYLIINISVSNIKSIVLKLKNI